MTETATHSVELIATSVRQSPATLLSAVPPAVLTDAAALVTEARQLSQQGNYLFDPEPQIGDRPRLIYDPADPEWNVADARLGPDFSAGWFFSVGAVVAAALIAPTWTGKIDWNSLR